MNGFPVNVKVYLDRVEVLITQFGQHVSTIDETLATASGLDNQRVKPVARESMLSYIGFDGRYQAILAGAQADPAATLADAKAMMSEMKSQATKLRPALTRTAVSFMQDALGQVIANTGRLQEDIDLAAARIAAGAQVVFI